MTSEVFSLMISERNHEGRNYFHNACEAGSLPLLYCVEPFLQPEHRHLLHVYDYEGYQPIHVAVMKGGRSAAYLIELLVGVGADINGKDRRGGDTALHLSIHHNDYFLVKWLCEQQSITLDALSSARKTPYQLAWTKDDRRMMKILEDHGADTEPPSDSSSASDSD